MARVFGMAPRLLLRPWQAIRHRPWLGLGLALVLVAGTAVGLWRYALHQWRTAQVALREDRPEEARERLALCLRVWPRSPEVHLLAARAARLTGDFPAAEAHLNRCLQLQGGASEGVQIEFLLMRVQAGEIDGDTSPVTALFEAVENGHPDAPAILETIARTYIRFQRYKPAYNCLSLWIRHEPDNPKPYHWRGWALERLSNPMGAQADYERALELDPDLIAVRLRVVEMLLEQKQAPEAMSHLQRLYRQAPDNPRVQARMGMCLFLQGQSDEARRLMEAALPHLPDDGMLLNSLAHLDLQDGRAADAERRLRAVLAADPFDTEALFALASALRFQGRTAEAEEALAEQKRKRAVIDRANALLKDVADSPKARAADYVEIGQLFLQMGRDNVGVYWLERALEKDPLNQAAHRGLAEHYERAGNPKAAAAHRQQIRGQ